MARTRTEIHALGDTWNPTVLWYAKAVAALTARPLTSKLSWLYMAAMHGFNQPLWQRAGIIHAGVAVPPHAEQGVY
ncbi:MAG TPA: hypothetical protein VKQ70_09865, partial [Caulobacteraceae bacterium]|nr:hypothetical protein [Caulobacteraceae bacterium]